MKFTIHFLNSQPIIDLSGSKDRIAIYDAKEGGHGISITRERFEKLIKAYPEALAKEQELKENLK